MASSYLIRSSDRIAVNSSSSSFTVPIYPSVINSNCVKLKYLSIPNTIYNIRNSNNILQFNDPSAGIITIVIQPMYYNIYTLVQTISEQMSQLGSQTYIITYNPNTYFVTFSATNPFTLNFGIANSIATVLGFDLKTTSTVNVLTSTNAVQLQIRSLYISIAEFTSKIYGFNGIPYTFVIPLDETAGNIIYFEDNKNFLQSIRLYNLPIYHLTVSLYFDNKELVDLHGSEWEALLEFLEY